MGKVTDFEYSLDNRMIPKFNSMIKRCTSETKKQDSVLIVEGKEGTGKTTYSVAIAYYVAHVTGRYFGADHVFFKIEDLLEAFQNTENQIFIWDEPALQMLSRDRSSIVADLTRLLMMARKNRHFLIINIAHFNKFNDYIIADRPIGMLHVYETKQRHVRALYIPQKNLRKLWDDYKRRYKKSYYVHRDRMVNVHCFPDVLNPSYRYNVLSEFDNDLYESNKSGAIKIIGKKDSVQKKTDEIKVRILKGYEIWSAETGGTLKEYAKLFGYAPNTLSGWKDRLKYGNSLKEFAQNLESRSVTIENSKTTPTPTH